MNFGLISSAILIGIGICLLTLNYWHTSSCGERPDAVKFNEVMHQRLLEAESLVRKIMYIYSYLFSH